MAMANLVRLKALTCFSKNAVVASRSLSFVSTRPLKAIYDSHKVGDSVKAAASNDMKEMTNFTAHKVDDAASDQEIYQEPETEWKPLDMTDEDLETKESMWNLYERWQTHQGISRKPDEKLKRFKIFCENARRIHEFNKQKDNSSTQGLNLFSDMTWKEVVPDYCVSHEINEQSKYFEQREEMG